METLALVSFPLFQFLHPFQLLLMSMGTDKVATLSTGMSYQLPL